MLRMRRATDQGFVVLAHFVRGTPGSVHTSREVAQATGLPSATTAKVLKALSRGGLLSSTRGLQGGYSLACDPGHTPILQVIEIFEGPVGLTDCSLPGLIACDDHDTCQLGPSWPAINNAVRSALRSVTLLDLVTGSVDTPVAAPSLTGTA